MVLLKNNSTQGIYITNDVAAKITGDTPGDLDLTTLVLGSTYIYFDTIARFEEKTTFNREEPDFIGFKTWSIDQNTVQASTGGGSKTVFLITVETDETTAELTKTFAKLNVKRAAGIKYLIKQTASEAFEKFPDSTSTLKQFASVIIRGIDVLEKADSGKDVKLINIACEQVALRN